MCMSSHVVMKSHWKQEWNGFNGLGPCAVFNHRAEKGLELFRCCFCYSRVTIEKVIQRQYNGFLCPWKQSQFRWAASNGLLRNEVCLNRFSVIAYRLCLCCQYMLIALPRHMSILFIYFRNDFLHFPSHTGLCDRFDICLWKERLCVETISLIFLQSNHWQMVKVFKVLSFCPNRKCTEWRFWMRRD